MIIQVISECITSLFRLGILVRKSTHRDRFKRALQVSDDAFPSMFDVDYVRQKHPKITKDWLVTRLGGGIAKRRQFIKYCRDHRTRLGVDDENQTLDAGTGTERLSSKATTFLPGTAQPLEVEDDVVSFVSASTMAESLQSLKLPQLADLSTDNQPFECPICFTLQSFRTEKSWRIHAFRDLKAYVCTIGQGECDDEFFGDRDSWFEHELKEHRAGYKCSLCQLGPLASKDIRWHIQASHGPFPDDQLKMLQDDGREAVTKFQAQDCPFCDDWSHNLSKRANNIRTNSEGTPDVVVSAGRFKRHVATHQEQLAIFALPRAPEADGTPASGSVAARSNSRASSLADFDDDEQGEEQLERSVGSVDNADLRDTTHPMDVSEAEGHGRAYISGFAWLRKHRLKRSTSHSPPSGLGNELSGEHVETQEGDISPPDEPVTGDRAAADDISERGITRDDENKLSHVDSSEQPRGSRNPGPSTQPAGQGADSWAARGYEFTGPADLARHDLVSRGQSHIDSPQPKIHLSDGVVIRPLDRYRQPGARNRSPVGYANPERASVPIRPSYARPYPYRGEEDRAVIVVTNENARPAPIYPFSRGRSPPRKEERTSPMEGHEIPPTPTELHEHAAKSILRPKDVETEAALPPGARWTKIARRLVSPDALTIGRERFEVRDDFVTVLRVLSREEIQAYSVATAQLRERRQAQSDTEEEAASASREDWPEIETDMMTEVET
ncbi:hypothetical protein GE09DRAFT_1224890 [Coniochaeta sp. 2T2.1]|nr:hypothetical protein GE09DRAFT_1224890 [Coniochaeta sp. 2T2.1]